MRMLCQALNKQKEKTIILMITHHTHRDQLLLNGAAFRPRLHEDPHSEEDRQEQNVGQEQDGDSDGEQDQPTEQDTQ